MSFLDKIGLAPKRKDLAPLIGERKKKAPVRTIRNNPYIRVLIIVLFTVGVIFSLPFSSYKKVANFEVGQPWRNDNLEAPFTFAIFKTQTELEQERTNIQEQTIPIFHLDGDAQNKMQVRIDSLLQSITPVLESYSSWQMAKSREDASSFSDSLRFMQEMSRTGLNLSDGSWQILLDNYHSIMSNDGNLSRFLGISIRNRLLNIMQRLANEGLMNVNKNTLSQTEITLRDLQNSTERTLNISKVRDLREALEYTQSQLGLYFSSESIEIAIQFYNRSILPNYIFNNEATKNRVQEALNNISLTKGAIAQGQMIIRRGDLVTTERANVLNSLAEARSANATESERWVRFGGIVLTVLMVWLMFYLYLFLYRPKIAQDNANLLLVFLVMGLMVFAASSISELYNLSPYILPVAIAPIIFTIIFDSRVGIVSGFTLAICVAIIVGNNFEYTVATVIACSLGVYSVRDIKNRAQFFFTTPGIVFLSYLIVTAGFSLAKFSTWVEFYQVGLMVGISSLFILFTYPIILIFEKGFGITTDFTLLELGDTNRPLLKELMNRAPGTFHHSLQVANLAESAASAIGANPLLCRVGAMYHDIGKIDKPEYFVENQSGVNEHEKLKPRMSALVIKAHVSEGVKLAQQNDLPDVLIDFIKTHHGTTVIRYFYEKAKTDPDLKSEIHKEDFRYEGPLPDSLETGIILLADGVEAASRAMKDPTYNKLQTLVNKMVDDRVAEGQLSQCPLTFRHLQIIKDIFLTILVGVHHGRVEYPEDSEKKPESAQGKREKANGITS